MYSTGSVSKVRHYLLGPILHQRNMSSMRSGLRTIKHYVVYPLVITGFGISSVAAYAIYDPDFRQFLQDTVPSSRPLFSKLYTPKNEASPSVIYHNKSAPIPVPLFPSSPMDVKFDKPSNDPVQQLKEDNKMEIVKIVDDLIDKKLKTFSDDDTRDMPDRIKLKVAKSELEDELNKELAKHRLLHAQHEEQMLKSQREQLIEDHEKRLQECLLKERQNYLDQLASAIARLSSLEVFLTGREEFDGINRRSKKLWISCQNLKSLLSKQTVNTKAAVSLSNVIKDIQDAGQSDEFVQELIKTIPSDSLCRGICTEEELLERYNKVKTWCRRFARVQTNNASLFNYLLSYLQSLLIWDGAKATSFDSFIDPENISAYEILSRTSYCLQSRDFESAAKLMSLLRGVPAKIAYDWIHDLRAHVEIRQISSSLMTHALAQSIRSVY